MSRLILGALRIACLALLLFFSGCGPPCSGACRHLLNECGLVDPWPSVDACVTECRGVRENLLDPQEQQTYDEHVRCLSGTRCEELDTNPEVCGVSFLEP